ncbi:MAG: hypothetical protein WCD53_15610 [Microcoleus sp.]
MTVRCSLFAVRWRHDHSQPSTVNCQPSTVNRQQLTDIGITHQLDR